MINRDHIERLLAINGIASTASDSEIKSVLIRARWHKDDVETAIEVLRENAVTHEKTVQTAQNLILTDDKLQPATITSLLGISTNVSENEIGDHSRAVRRQLTASLMMQIALIALVLSLTFVCVAMWYLEMGLFHEVGAFHNFAK